MTKSRGINTPKFDWTADRKAEFATRYPNEKAEAIAQDFGCALHVLYSRAKALKLRKSEEFLKSEESGRLSRAHQKGIPNRFVKGQKSWITGKKGINPGPGETRFKPGTKPHNHVPVGTEQIKADGCIWVKLAEPNIWKQKHWLVWKEAHGKFPPKGSLFNFKDGNKLNFELENLELFTRQEWMRKHTVHNLPAEIVEVVLLRGALVRQINKRTAK